MTLSGAGLVTNDDTLTVAGTLTVSGATITGGTIVDSGSIDASGSVDIASAITGTGSFTIESGATLKFDGSVVSGIPVSFSDATGTLALSDPANFDAIVTGLQVGDIIDLTTTTVTSATWNGTALTINGATAAINTSGLPSGDAFFFASDGGAGTDFTVNTAPTVTIGTIESNNIINASDAAAGFTISGTAADSGVVLTGQTVTIDIVNNSGTTVDFYNGTIGSNGSWSINVAAGDAQALTDGAYTVTANVTEVAVSSTTQATQALTVDESPPVITSGTTASVNEGVASNTVVYTATATDPDGDTVTYALSGANASAFAINANTGAVTINAVPSFESQEFV